MKKRILSLALMAVLFSQANAQSSLRDVIRGDNGTTKHFVTLSAAQQMTFTPQQAKSLFKLDAGSDLVLIKTTKDELGQTNYRFTQTYNSIPVEGSMYIVQTKNSKATALSGEIITDFSALTSQKAGASVTGAQAVTTAVNYVKANLYAWQDPEMEQRIKEQTGNPKATYAPSVKLVWFSTNEESLDAKSLVLCYKVDVYARQPLSRADYFVNAKTGAVIGKNDKLYFTDATGTAATAWSGSQTIHSDFTGSAYRLRDYTKGSGVITLHGESSKRGNDYTSATANWSLAGFDQAALDAHYGVSQTYAFYSTAFARNSYDGAGTALYSYVNDPTYIDNAFWDGSAMNYNKRSTNEPGGVTGIDVTGHELTHGVTQSESNLTYSKESGAMNESLSDIFGKCVQFWSKPTDINWGLSNDMNWFIRDLSNPNAYSQPDTYKGTNWVPTSSFYDNGGVHTNSGVGNYFFYLLVNGGTGTNDNGEAYTVAKIGLKKAASILYRTNTIYLVPGSKYADWRTACISAATDLYGANSKATIQVQNAWHAVGVGPAAPALVAAATSEDEVMTAIKANTLLISPNPVTGSNAVVSYSLVKEGKATLKIIDLNGRTMQNVELGNQASGAHTYVLGSVSKMPAGNYVVIIEQNGIIVSRSRFLVSK
ncbi:MAG: M4 family metallopeptidase [Panacibacter sp.]